MSLLTFTTPMPSRRKGIPPLALAALEREGSPANSGCNQTRHSCTDFLVVKADGKPLMLSELESRNLSTGAVLDWVTERLQLELLKSRPTLRGTWLTIKTSSECSLSSDQEVVILLVGVSHPPLKHLLLLPTKEATTS